MKKIGNAKEATDVDVGSSTRDDTEVAKDYIPAKPAFQEPGVQKKGNNNNYCGNSSLDKHPNRAISSQCYMPKE